LKEIDLVNAEATKTSLALLAQIGGVSLLVPLIRPDRVNPAFVAIVRPSGYGESTSRTNSSATFGPYESAVSMKLTSNSTLRRKTSIAP